MADEKACFVIAPIGEPESDERRRSDQILKHIIKPAAKECGYSATRADEISEPGIITSQVIQRIVNDPLVIADLTGRNPNVFYELAIRHALRKPLVQMIRKGDAIPFDVAATRVVLVDHHDLDSVEAAKMEITKQIRAAEKDAANVDTPISVALDLQLLKQSDDPEKRSLADLMSMVAEVRTSVAGIEKVIAGISRVQIRDSCERSLRDKLSKLESSPSEYSSYYSHRSNPASLAEVMDLIRRSGDGVAEHKLSKWFLDANRVADDTDDEGTEE